MINSIHLALVKFMTNISDFLQLASPPGKGRTKPNPSPILTSKKQRGHHPSISDDDNAFEEKEEVRFTYLKKLYHKKCF